MNLRDILSNKKLGRFQDDRYTKDLFRTENILSEATKQQLKILEEKAANFRKELQKKAASSNSRSKSSGNISKLTDSHSYMELPKIKTIEGFNFSNIIKSSSVHLLNKFVKK